MLTYDLTDENIPLYEQLYRAIHRDIEDGVLSPGEHMPSRRAFASHLGVSTITVENAYDQLLAEGYLISIPRKGYFIAELPKRPKTQVTETRLSGFEIPKKKEYQFDFSSNRVSEDSFPFSIWAKILRETLSENRTELLTIPEPAGIIELRQAIAHHLMSFRGMSVDPNQIVIGAGTEYLYRQIVLLLGRDRSYAVENPGYPKLKQIYDRSNVRTELIEMDEMGARADSLRKSGASVAILSPNHHFPTGITMPASRRYEILAWASESDRYIIEDDYDSEFRQNGRPLPTLQSMDGMGRVIYMNTFTKSLASTMRIGYMVLPPELVKSYYETMAFYSCTVSTFDQYTLAKFIDRGYFEKHINRMRLQYGRERTEILQILEDSLGDLCEVEESDSGLHLILKLHTKKDDAEVKKELEEKDIHISAISDYYMNSSDEKSSENVDHSHRFLLNYSNLDVTELPNMLEALKNAL